MAQLDRLSATDASFLHQERESSHMHIGGAAVFAGPAPSLEEFLAHLEVRLAGLPRYRQKLAFGTLGPRWVDDPNFDLRFHVRAAALPSPAGDAELAVFIAQVAGQRLDRHRPLWECWLVEAGPEHFALVFKSHHAMVDGVSNFDLATVLLDLEPGGAASGFGLGSSGGWSPRSAPTRRDLLVADARDAAGLGLGLAGRALGAALRPGRAVREAVEIAQGVGEFAWAALNPAPATPLNVEIGPHRRYALVHQQLADYKTVKDTFGGTVNDVVLTVVSGALRRWFVARDEPVEELELRALVPVSVRGSDEHGTMGNRLTLFRAPLPLGVEDPVAALGVVRGAMQDLKDSRQAVGAASLAAAAQIAPPGVLAQASRLQFSTRLFNLLVTNIPGPQFPLYLLGRRAEAMYPLPFLAEHHGLAVAIISYDGGLEYGLLGDYAALADLDVIAEGIEATLEELLAAAAAAAAVRRTRRARPATRAGRPRRAAAPRLAAPSETAAPPAPGSEAPAPPEPDAAAPSEPDGAAPSEPDAAAPRLTETPLMASTTRRGRGPASDMRARHRRH
ncbi:MAG TPA: wax ester/triacylglycerol synthase family O-acyltransferase [Solirubrobacteraceae bacterium]|nr:wax ester/triacylglycerol synthase family O-acyltransferase [Solirubrobacteraceae bacterium]